MTKSSVHACVSVLMYDMIVTDVFIHPVLVTVCV